MAETRRDLWPDDIDVRSIVPPVVILQEQASALRERTKGLVVGHVESIEQPAEEIEEYLGDAISPEMRSVHTHTLYLVAPALDNYRYSLLSVTHDFQPYPCRVSFHPAPGEYLGELQGRRYRTTDQLHTEEQFVIWLRAVFCRAETRRVTHALVSRIQMGTEG